MKGGHPVEKSVEKYLQSSKSFKTCSLRADTVSGHFLPGHSGGHSFQGLDWYVCKLLLRFIVRYGGHSVRKLAADCPLDIPDTPHPSIEGWVSGVRGR